MIGWIFFGVLAFATLASAVQVVRTTDLVHAVLWLALSLLGTAGLYVTLDAGFLAAIQVLLYTGGVVTLMLFAVMLSRRTGGEIPAGGATGFVRAAIAGLAVFGLVASAVLRDASASSTALGTLDAKALGALLLSDAYALPFEVLSVLLLAAMVGAILLARRKDA